MQILLAIIALSFLIIIHELGHFTVAKLSGIKVQEFSLFMGPKLFSFKKGETDYSFRLIPLGGYVRMEGEEQASEDERAFNKKPVLIRMAVIAAGPITNLIAALLILAVIFSFTGYSTNKLAEMPSDSVAAKAGLVAGDKIISFDNKTVMHPMDLAIFSYESKDRPVKIGYVREGKSYVTTVTPKKIEAQKLYRLGISTEAVEGENSNVIAQVANKTPAQKSGLQAGDRIIAMNNTTVSSKQDIDRFMRENGEKMLKITVLRNGAQEVTMLTPMVVEQPEQYDLGMEFGGDKDGILPTIGAAFTYTVSTVRSVFYSILWLITGTVSLNQLMGPVGIVSTIGSAVQQPTLGLMLVYLFNLVAFLSINLGIMNLIPFPALDGSKILLLAVEGIRKKAIPPEKEAMISMVGFVLLIMLMIFATYNDIARLIGKG